MPDQRKGANKQTEKGQRSFRKIQQVLGNLFLVTKNQVQRPQRNTQHDDHVGHRTDLYVYLIGNNRNSDDQAIANQTAQRTQSPVPVTGAGILNGKGPQFRHVRTEDQSQNGFEKFDQGKGVQKQSLLKRDGATARVQPVAQQLTDKQGKRQQKQINNKGANDHCR